MKLIRFNGVIEIEDDAFYGEYDGDVGTLMYWAFEHGHSSGEFFICSEGRPTIEDIEETE